MDIAYSFLVIICLAGRGLGQSIIDPPSPATSLLGETATFSCEIDMVASAYMEWYFQTELIYWYDDGDEVYPSPGEKYSVELLGQVFTLTVSNLVLSDGGLYGCKVPRANAVTVALLVLEAPSVGPTTPNIVESSISTYSCEAYFGGPARVDIVLNHYPQLRMFLRGNLLEGPITEKLPEGPITYYVISMATNVTLEANMNGEAITCEISTVSPAESVTDSHDMVVHYSVRGINYVPKQDIFSIGSIISCFADGNPEPTFEWRNTAGVGGSVQTRNMTITEEMVGMNTWECQADNTVGGTPYSETVQASFAVCECLKVGVSDNHLVKSVKAVNTLSISDMTPEISELKKSNSQMLTENEKLKVTISAVLEELESTRKRLHSCEQERLELVKQIANTITIENKEQVMPNPPEPKTSEFN